MAGSAKLLADVVLGHVAHFPSAIEMFEVFADVPGLGFIAENQVCISHRPGVAEVLSLAFHVALIAGNTMRSFN